MLSKCTLSVLLYLFCKLLYFISIYKKRKFLLVKHVFQLLIIMFSSHYSFNTLQETQQVKKVGSRFNELTSKSRKKLQNKMT